MPRNHYAKDARDIEREQIARQEKELAVAEAKLHGQEVQSPEVSLTNKVKERRSARLEQKRRYKDKRRGGAADSGQK